MVQFLPLFGRHSYPCLAYYAVTYMTLIVVQMMLDATYFQSLINVAANPEAQINLYQCILIPVHCFQATLQFFFGFDLHKAIVKKSCRLARNWQMIFFFLLAVEVSIFFAYIALAAFLCIFTYVTAVAIVFKVYLIWPLKIFLEEYSEVDVPLVHTPDHHQHHHHRQDVPPIARPGPSSTSTNRLLRGISNL